MGKKKTHRVFNGRSYHRTNSRPLTKKTAQGRARGARGAGMNARVVKAKGGYNVYETGSYQHRHPEADKRRKRRKK